MMRNCTYILDFLRFLSKRTDITKDKLQLVGITALHMAAKLEVKKNALSIPSFLILYILSLDLSTSIPNFHL